jgi:hypothetical protein
MAAASRENIYKIRFATNRARAALTCVEGSVIQPNRSCAAALSVMSGSSSDKSAEALAPGKASTLKQQQHCSIALPPI